MAEQDELSTGKPYINRDNLADVPPPNANYRAGDAEHNCGNCLYFEDGACAVWNAKVQSNQVCVAWDKDENMDDEYYAATGTVPGYTMSELYCSSGNATDSNGYVVKTVLRTGTWRYSPDPITQAPIPKPLYVVNGHSTDPQKEIGLADIIEAYKAGAVEHVTVPLSHNDKVNENTGFIKDLFIEPDPDTPGESCLKAAIEFTDSDIKDKVSNGSIANTSVGLLFNKIRTNDGKKFPIALAHVALTNHPWINGMEPFGVTASENSDLRSLATDAEEFTSLVLDTVAPEDESTETVLWDEDDSLRCLEIQVQDALNDLYEPNDDDPQNSGVNPYFVRDLSSDRALVTNFDSGNTYVVSFTTGDPDNDGDTDVVLPPFDQWVLAEQAWVKASEALSERLVENWQQRRSVELTDYSSVKRKGFAKKGIALPDGSYPIANVDDLKNAIRAIGRAKNPGKAKAHIVKRAKALKSTNLLPDGWSLSLSDNRQHKASNNQNGGNSMADLLEGLELADDVRAQLESALDAQNEVDRLREDARKRDVEEKVEKLKEIGFSEQPGLLAYVRSVMLSDDGGSTLLLSEDGKSETKLTPTDVIEGFIERLPKDDGKINFGQQATNFGTSDERPSKDATGENKTAKQRADDAREWLYNREEE